MDIHSLGVCMQGVEWATHVWTFMLLARFTMGIFMVFWG